MNINWKNLALSLRALERMDGTGICLVTGPSCVGKTTLIDSLLEQYPLAFRRQALLGEGTAADDSSRRASDCFVQLIDDPEGGMTAIPLPMLEDVTAHGTILLIEINPESIYAALEYLPDAHVIFVFARKDERERRMRLRYPEADDAAFLKLCEHAKASSRLTVGLAEGEANVVWSTTDFDFARKPLRTGIHALRNDALRSIAGRCHLWFPDGGLDEPARTIASYRVRLNAFVEDVPAASIDAHLIEMFANLSGRGDIIELRSR